MKQRVGVCVVMKDPVGRWLDASFNPLLGRHHWPWRCRVGTRGRERRRVRCCGVCACRLEDTGMIGSRKRRLSQHDDSGSTPPQGHVARNVPIAEDGDDDSSASTIPRDAGLDHVTADTEVNGNVGTGPAAAVVAECLTQLRTAVVPVHGPGLGPRPDLPAALSMPPLLGSTGPPLPGLTKHVQGDAAAAGARLVGGGQAWFPAAHGAFPQTVAIPGSDGTPTSARPRYARLTSLVRDNGQVVADDAGGVWTEQQGAAMAAGGADDYSATRPHRTVWMGCFFCVVVDMAGQTSRPRSPRTLLTTRCCQ